jgi:hypothetical protein
MRTFVRFRAVFWRSAFLRVFLMIAVKMATI